ncbi:TPA: peptide deformylase, partial [bacterium]|nr:peptide deformylase [bacterium]
MNTLDIRLYGDPILRRKCLPVKKIDTITELVSKMIEIMYLHKGVGLAAPQVGMAKRVIVVDTSEERNSLIILINPEIINQEGEEIAIEGCLSLPGISAEVSRSKKVRVKGLSFKGQEVQMEGEGLLARAFLHEIDHLDGILFIDRISKEKK